MNPPTDAALGASPMLSRILLSAGLLALTLISIGVVWQGWPSEKPLPSPSCTPIISILEHPTLADSRRLLDFGILALLGIPALATAALMFDGLVRGKKQDSLVSAGVLLALAFSLAVAVAKPRPVSEPPGPASPSAQQRPCGQEP